MSHPGVETFSGISFGGLAAVLSVCHWKDSASQAAAQMQYLPARSSLLPVLNNLKTYGVVFTITKIFFHCYVTWSRSFLSADVTVSL